MKARETFLTTSWDDGHPLDMRLADLLAKYGLPATFYVPIQSERRGLAPAQIQAISRRFEIGAHTVSHCDLTSVTREVARHEIVDCKAALEQITGQACPSFCFPLGRFHRYHLGEARAAGYLSVRTVELVSLDEPRVLDGLAVMSTTLQTIPAGLATFARNSLKRLRPSNFVRYVRCRRDGWVETAQVLMNDAISTGGAFHLWGHSWEIEKLNQWENVERIFAFLSEQRGRAIFVNNRELAVRSMQIENRSGTLPEPVAASSSAGDRLV